jgi:hypothetical protein
MDVLVALPGRNIRPPHAAPLPILARIRKTWKSRKFFLHQ